MSRVAEGEMPPMLIIVYFFGFCGAKWQMFGQNFQAYIYKKILIFFLPNIVFIFPWSCHQHHSQYWYNASSYRGLFLLFSLSGLWGSIILEGWTLIVPLESWECLFWGSKLNIISNTGEKKKNPRIQETHGCMINYHKISSYSFQNTP